MNLELQEELDWTNETQPSKRLPSADCGTSQEKFCDNNAGYVWKIRQ